MIKIVRDTSDNKDFQTLIGLLDDDLNAKYGIIQAQYDLYNKTDKLETIVVGYIDNKPAGCGCFKLFTEDSVEIKRMIVTPENRGSGIAMMILLELEKWALEQGYSRSVLETGTRQPDAVRFYTKLGYKKIPNYRQYLGDSMSICMEKKLQE